MADVPPDPPPPPNPSGISNFPPGVKPETRYVIIKGDYVVGMCFSIMDRFVPNAPPEQGVTIIQSDDAQVGWIYDGENLFPPVPQKSEEQIKEDYQRALKSYDGEK